MIYCHIPPQLGVDKPHFYKRWGLWYCRFKGRVGHGVTPKEAQFNNRHAMIPRQLP